MGHESRLRRAKRLHRTRTSDVAVADLFSGLGLSPRNIRRIVDPEAPSRGRPVVRFPPWKLGPTPAELAHEGVRARRARLAARAVLAKMVVTPAGG